MVNLATQATQAPRFRQSFFSNQPAHFRRWALAVLLLAALLFLLRLGDRGLWGSESRWGEITRELHLARDLSPAPFRSPQRAISKI